MEATKGSGVRTEFELPTRSVTNALSMQARGGIGVEGGGRRGNEPTQTYARGGRLNRNKTAGLDEVDADGVRAGEAVGSGVVEETGKKVDIAIGRTPYDTPNSRTVCREDLQPALKASVSLADFGDILERFVVGVDQELGGHEVTAETFDGPDDATGFEVEESPPMFVFEDGAADEDDGADGAAG